MKRCARIFTLMSLALLTSACEGVQSALDVAGSHAGRIKFMWEVMLWVCGFMYMLVLLFLFASMLRRRREQVPEHAQETPQSAPLARAFKVWTALVVVGLVGLNLTSYAVDRGLFELNRSTLDLEVSGEQWWWNIKYQNAADPSQNFTTANEIHLPVNHPVHIALRSSDVIHSFWVPNLNGKQDLIPGRDTDIYLRPTRIGAYRGQCAEFCGLQHAHMAFDVIVESRDDFDRWRAQQLQPAAEPGNDTAKHGRDFFMSSACPLCHTIRGTDAGGITGPDLTHLASRRSLAAGTLPNHTGDLAAWIADPQTPKPGNHMPVIDIEPPQLQSLTAYLQGLH